MNHPPLAVPVRPARAVAPARSPVQARGRDRVEAVLLATRTLLQVRDPDEVTIAMVAEQAGMGRASVYQFFPTLLAIYRTLALRFLEEHAAWLRARSAARAPQDWAEALDLIIEESADLYDRDATGRKLLLGGGRYELRLMDQDYDLHASALIRDLHGALLPPLPEVGADPIRIVVVVVAAIFSLAVREQGSIGPAMRREAKRAARGYLERLGAHWARDPAGPVDRRR